MNVKVEVQGLDTSKLPKLSQKEQMEMLKRIKNGENDLKDEFIEANLRLVLSIIKKFNNRGFRVTRSLRDLAYLISQEKEKYVREKNEEPTIDEICKLVNASKEDVVLAIDSMVTPMSIYDSVYNDGGDQIFLLDQLKNEKEESEQLIDNIAIKQMLNKLNEKERRIIERRYFQDKTQTELASELGVSQAQISRIEKNALEKIKKRYDKNS